MHIISFILPKAIELGFIVNQHDGAEEATIGLCFRATDEEYIRTVFELLGEQAGIPEVEISRIGCRFKLLISITIHSVPVVLIDRVMEYSVCSPDTYENCRLDVGWYKLMSAKKRDHLMKLLRQREFCNFYVKIDNSQGSPNFVWYSKLMHIHVSK